MRKVFAILSLGILVSFHSFATSTAHQEKPWGLGIVSRGVNSSFVDDTGFDPSVVPLFYYQGELLFLNGLELGAHLYKHDNNQVNIVSRMALFDGPEKYRATYKGYYIDSGFQWLHKLQDNWQLGFEILSDLDGRVHGNISSSWDINSGDWQVLPSISAHFKSADFNSQYFALAEASNETIGGGAELTAAIEMRYHVNSNFYLIGSAGVNLLDDNAYQSNAIEQRWNNELYLGFAFFNDKSTPKKDSIASKAYLRVSHGWSTPSDIGDIIIGHIDSDRDGVKDQYNNQLSSIFYGLPLTDEFFGYPVDIYLTPGFSWHWDSEVQSTAQEYVLAFKAFTTFTWPVTWRIGLAEGLSYISEITYIEAKEMAWKGYDGSKLLNYIDVSIDVNLGDLFNISALDNTWLGYGLHHRSAVFGGAEQYGRIEGGSNYNTVYLQFDF